MVKTVHYNVERPKNVYYYDPKFLDRQVWANNADPDQIAQESSLFAITVAIFAHITIWYDLFRPISADVQSILKFMNFTV